MVQLKVTADEKENILIGSLGDQDVSAFTTRNTGLAV